MTFAFSFIEILVGILLLFGGGELFVAGSVALSLLLGIAAALFVGFALMDSGQYQQTIIWDPANPPAAPIGPRRGVQRRAMGDGADPAPGPCLAKIWFSQDLV